MVQTEWRVQGQQVGARHVVPRWARHDRPAKRAELHNVRGNRKVPARVGRQRAGYHRAELEASKTTHAEDSRSEFQAQVRHVGGRRTIVALAALVSPRPSPCCARTKDLVELRNGDDNMPRRHCPSKGRNAPTMGQRYVTMYRGVSYNPD